MNIPDKTYTNQCCCPEIPKDHAKLEEPKPDNIMWMPTDGKTEMANRYLGLRVVNPDEGIRRRKMKERFWNEMLQKALDETATPVEPQNYCTEYNSNFYKDNFEPRKLEVMDDANVSRAMRRLFMTLVIVMLQRLSKIPFSRNTVVEGYKISFSLQVKLKYPLYGTGSSAITFYSENIEKRGPGCNILEKFRKSQYYTKPMEERMDDGWVL